MRSVSVFDDADRFWAQVDKTETCWNWQGTLSSAGYGLLTSDYTESVQAHRLAYILTNGHIPAGLLVDHLCHNPKCVNPDHMRLATYAENAQNRKGATALSKSGHRGVVWHPPTSKWRVAASKEGKRHYGGYFTDLDEAVAAVKELRASLYTPITKGA